MPMPYTDCGPKICEFCKGEYRRRRQQSTRTFQRSKFCSLTCANSRRDVTEGTLRWRARKLRGPKCEACGTTRKLQAHHVDQDIANNHPTNIQTLCKECHDFWHATQRRLGWLIAGRMPALNWDGRTASPESPMESPTGYTDLGLSATVSSHRSPSGSVSRS